MQDDTLLAPSPSGECASPVEQHPAGYISTGVTREPRDGDWMRCLHPECASETRLHQAGRSCFPYPECEIFVAVGSSAPIFAIDAEGISAMLPAEGAPQAHITWEALDRWRAEVNRYSVDADGWLAPPPSGGCAVPVRGVVDRG